MKEIDTLKIKLHAMNNQMSIYKDQMEEEKIQVKPQKPRFNQDDQMDMDMD